MKIVVILILFLGAVFMLQYCKAGSPGYNIQTIAFDYTPAAGEEQIEMELQLINRDYFAANPTAHLHYSGRYYPRGSHSSYAKEQIVRATHILDTMIARDREKDFPYTFTMDPSCLEHNGSTALTAEFGPQNLVARLRVIRK